MTLLINTLTIGSIVCSLLVISSKNPVLSVLFLIGVFVNIAGYLLIMGLGFIGLSYIVVYVGAVAVLFLFVIIMLNLQEDELNTTGINYTQNGPVAVILGGFFLFVNFIASNFHTIQSSIFIKTNSVAQGSFSWINQNLFIDSSTNKIEGLINVNEIFFINFPDTIFSPINTLQINSLAVNLYTYGGIWIILLAFSLLLAIISPIILTINCFNEPTT